MVAEPSLVAVSTSTEGNLVQQMAQKFREISSPLINLDTKPRVDINEDQEDGQDDAFSYNILHLEGLEDGDEGALPKVFTALYD